MNALIAKFNRSLNPQFARNWDGETLSPAQPAIPGGGYGRAGNLGAGVGIVPHMNFWGHVVSPKVAHVWSLEGQLLNRASQP